MKVKSKYVRKIPHQIIIYEGSAILLYPCIVSLVEYLL